MDDEVKRYELETAIDRLLAELDKVSQPDDVLSFLEEHAERRRKQILGQTEPLQ